MANPEDELPLPEAKERSRNLKLSIEFDEPDRIWHSGERVQGRIVASAPTRVECSGLTLQRRWEVGGSGSGECGKLLSERLFAGVWEAGREYAYPFEFDAPAGPFPYAGKHLQLSWVLRARASIPGRDAKATEYLPLLPGSEQPDYTGDYALGWAPGTGPNRTVPERRLNWLTMSLVVLVAILGGLVLAGGIVDGSGRMGAIGAMIMAFSFYFLFQEWSKRVLGRRLGEVAFELSERAPRRGALIEGVVRLTPARDVELKSIRLTLLGEEQAMDEQADDRTTLRHTFHKVPVAVVAATSLKRGERTEFAAQLQIPRDAPPSFHGTSNRISWTVRARVDVPKLPNWNQEVELTVRP